MNYFSVMADSINTRKEIAKRNIEKKIMEYIKSYIKRRVKEYINDKKKQLKLALNKINPINIFKNIIKKK